MTIPNLPTDNLYKFKALSGLTLIILSIFLFVTESKKIMDEMGNIETEMKIQEAELKFLDFDASEINKERKDIELEIKKADKDLSELEENFYIDTTISKYNQYGLLNKYLISKDKDEARKDIEFRIKHKSDFLPLLARQKLSEIKIKQYDSLNRQIAIKQVQIEGKINILKYKYIYVSLLYVVVMFLLVFGWIFTKNAFSDWENIVQKLQDEKLKLEIKELNSKTKEV